MPYTIKDIIDRIIAAVPEAPIEDSVDTFKSGDPSQAVTGIVTTFTATMGVLRKAVELGANLVITHEPTYYDHRDDISWLGTADPVSTAKRNFIEKHGLVIWRFHDYWHMHNPDGIITGVARALDWEQHFDTEYEQQVGRLVIKLPPTPLGEVVEYIRSKLRLPNVRVVGKPEMLCQRVGLLVGAVGGMIQTRAFEKLQLDTIICGETVEWQTCEYVRDATALNIPRALIILGHANSEEEGMRYLVEWLEERVKGVPITYIAVGDPVKVM